MCSKIFLSQTVEVKVKAAAVSVTTSAQLMLTLLPEPKPPALKPISGFDAMPILISTPFPPVDLQTDRNKVSPHKLLICALIMLRGTGLTVHVAVVPRTDPAHVVSDHHAIDVADSDLDSLPSCKNTKKN